MPSKKGLSAHKFGGTSLANADRFKAVKVLLKGRGEVVVVSAVCGVTAALQALLDQAQAHLDFSKGLDAIRSQHTDLIAALLPPSARKRHVSELKQDIQDIADILHAIHLASTYSKEMQDIILSYGERWSAKIMTAFLGQGRRSKVLYLDASRVLFTRLRSHLVEIDWPKTRAAFKALLRDQSFDQLVVTGFIAANEQGKLTTLPRNSSDATAAVFANLLGVQSLTIWTDVDGIFSADPTRVNSAFVIEALSYKEALELAFFGAKVLHPWAIAPAMEKKIPITIRNSLNPKSTGTTICAVPSPSRFMVKGLTSIDDVALINVEGAGMVGVSGIASRVFKTMSEHKVSVILISQASSEHSICFVVRKTDAELAVRALLDEFEYELSQQRIERIWAERNCVILAAVGDGMVGTKGISGRLFSTLAKANVNIRAIAQGSSERNVSVVVAKEDENRALRAVHAGFYLSNKSISIGVIGHGVVGSAFIEQIYRAAEELRESLNVNLLVRGITDSKRMLLADKEIDLDHWDTHLERSGKKANLDGFITHILSEDIPHAVIVDCTASQHVADHYLECLEKGIHIVTPNKRAVSGDLKTYQGIRSLVRQRNVSFLYEATVGAGLPVIKTLQDLLQTGDEVIDIQGIVSGSLSYIFNEIEAGKTFSKAVLAAKRLGYTEPDPREDLSGMDVARKIVTLAREVGHMISLRDVKVHNLVPKALRGGDLKNFLKALPKQDAAMKKQFSGIRRRGEGLKYVGVIKADGKIEVDIKSYPATHPFSQLKGTDNMLIFRTKRYCEQPLVIQGPGAGADVTAAGVFADLLRVVSFLS